MHKAIEITRIDRVQAEPTEVVASRVSTVRIGPPLSGDSRHPAPVISRWLDARQVLNPTIILQVSQAFALHQVRSNVVGPSCPTVAGRRPEDSSCLCTF